MASPSGTSSGTSSLMSPNSGSEENLQALMDQRKRKRMLSNRESARRSRMRKQKYLDDLMAQVSQLKEENHQIHTRLNVTTQHYWTVEADNSILRAQVGELNHRLESLNEIITFLNAATASNSDYGGFGDSTSAYVDEPVVDSWLNPLNSVRSYLNQALMASVGDNIFQC